MTTYSTFAVLTVATLLVAGGYQLAAMRLRMKLGGDTRRRSLIEDKEAALSAEWERLTRLGELHHQFFTAQRAHRRQQALYPGYEVHGPAAARLEKVVDAAHDVLQEMRAVPASRESKLLD
jgi:hypothetical protein